MSVMRMHGSQGLSGRMLLVRAGPLQQMCGGVMTRIFENCGRATLKKGGFGAYCNKKKADVVSVYGPSLKCPCEHWVHRMRTDRLRKGKRR